MQWMGSVHEHRSERLPDFTAEYFSRGEVKIGVPEVRCRTGRWGASRRGWPNPEADHH